MVYAPARHPAAAEAREGTPLLRIVGGRGGGGGARALRSKAVLAVLALGVVAGCACIGIMAGGSSMRGFELVQQRTAGGSGNGAKLQREIDMARMLWTKGEAEQENGQKDIRSARMLAMQILVDAAEGGGNSTNGTNSTEGEGELGPSLQNRGVNVNHWPFYEKYKHVQHVYNDTSPGAPNATADEGDEEKENLAKHGVNVGRWFWDDEHFSDKDMSGGGNATNETDAGAEGGNGTNSTGGGDDLSPDDKLEGLGVNVDTSFWDGPPATMPKVKLEHKAVGDAAFQQLYRRGGLDGWFDLRRRGVGREAEGREDGAMRRAVGQREGRYGRLARR